MSKVTYTSHEKALLSMKSCMDHDWSDIRFNVDGSVKVKTKNKWITAFTPESARVYLDSADAHDELTSFFADLEAGIPAEEPEAALV